MKLKIKNFQNISKADLEFPEGEITALTGESNNGKTSVLRAIRAIITNPQGSKHYIKHGTDKATVELENNGETLLWERTKSTTNYKYKDEEYKKCSKQSSSDFCDLGFVTDTKGNLLNLSGEWDVAFPFGYSDTELFKIFEDLFSICDSAKVLDGMKADETSCNRDKLLLQDKLNIANERLIKGLELSEKLSKLPKPEIIKNVLLKKSRELEELKNKFNEVLRLEQLSKLEVPSKSFNTDYLSEIGKQLLELYKACSKACQIPKNLVVPNAEYFVFDLESLANINKAYISYNNGEINLKTLNKAKSELDESIKKLQEMWDTIDVCPLCGGRMK